LNMQTSFLCAAWLAALLQLSCPDDLVSLRQLCRFLAASIDLPRRVTLLILGPRF